MRLSDITRLALLICGYGTFSLAQTNTRLPVTVYAQENSASKHYEKLTIDQLVSEIEKDRMLEKQNAVAISELQARVDKLTHILTGTSTPLKVRGGAMAFKAKSALWGKDGNDSCVQMTATYIEVNDVGDLNSAKPVPDLVLSDIPTWQLNVYGRSTDGSKESAQGVRMRPTTTCIVNGAAAAGVTFHFLGNSQFYPTNSPEYDEEGNTRRERFQDKNCQTAPGTGDEDSCEQMHSIYVNSVFYDVESTAKANAFSKLLCISGECTLRIGSPN